MALGGAPLMLTLWLWVWLVPGPGLGQDDKEDVTQIGAPPNLMAQIPEAAMATVAAGYTEVNNSEATTKPPPLVSVSITFSAETQPEILPQTSPEKETLPQKETVLIVGDTHYAWKEWSAWHCNCAAGSMSRVRDITYSQPHVRLNPAEYDILRFERVACDTQACHCKEGQCNASVVTCNQGSMHLCALQDIQQDKENKRKDFWTQVHEGLRDLWQRIKDTFPPEQEQEAKPKQ